MTPARKVALCFVIVLVVCAVALAVRAVLFPLGPAAPGSPYTPSESPGLGTGDHAGAEPGALGMAPPFPEVLAAERDKFDAAIATLVSERVRRRGVGMAGLRERTLRSFSHDLESVLKCYLAQPRSASDPATKEVADLVEHRIPRNPVSQPGPAEGVRQVLLDALRGMSLGDDRLGYVLYWLGRCDWQIPMDLMLPVNTLVGRFLDAHPDRVVGIVGDFACVGQVSPMIFDRLLAKLRDFLEAPARGDRAVWRSGCLPELFRQHAAEVPQDLLLALDTAEQDDWKYLGFWIRLSLAVNESDEIVLEFLRRRGGNRVGPSTYASAVIAYVKAFRSLAVPKLPELLRRGDVEVQALAPILADDLKVSSADELAQQIERGDVVWLDSRALLASR